ncbi:MAG: cyanophycinase [Planctomycetota bacterium]|jgi:cyanophycinase
MLRLGSLTLYLSIFSLCSATSAQQAIDPAGIKGQLLIAGGGGMPAEIYARFAELGGGSKGRMVLIPSASQAADDQEEMNQARSIWEKRFPGMVAILHSRDAERVNEDSFAAPLRQASAVWISGGSQSRLTAAYLGTKVEAELHALLDRGGIIGGSSAGAAVMSRLMIKGGRRVAETTEGFGFAPGMVIDQHFLARVRQPRLLGVLADHPQLFGMGIDEGTAVLMDGRRMHVLGESKVVMLLAPVKGRAAHQVILSSGENADLIAWQRAARDRLEPAKPEPAGNGAALAKGTVMMVGGGDIDRQLLERFIQEAGGRESNIVLVPTAGGAQVDSQNLSFASRLQNAGAGEVRIFHAAHPSQVEAAENLDALRSATGLWFTGGRQWRLVDAYEGTLAEELFRQVLERGGIIGGSSAGTSIQPSFMVRGNPLGNRDIAALGYTRGFGYLQGVAADQHFSQRNRFADMSELLQAHPRLLGLGIDESTAAIVKGNTLEVSGPGQVAVYDYVNRPPRRGEKDYVQLGNGERYDLSRRAVIE